MHEFVLLTVHQPITISASGFFNIDFKLLGSVITPIIFVLIYLKPISFSFSLIALVEMVASVVTYLLILVQFKLSV